MTIYENATELERVTEPIERPLISLVIPVYNSEEYLTDLLNSIARQDIRPGLLDLIFVDDGSSDNSVDRIRRWINSSPLNARIILHAENQGVHEARNTGIRAARGYWISFPDSDDILAVDYLKGVVETINACDEIGDTLALVSTNLIFYNEESRTYHDTYPLRFKYQLGRRHVRLSEYPHYIQLGTPTTFFRLDNIRERRLSFDNRIQPASEDTVFTAHYSLGFDDPIVAVVPDSRYYYRRRVVKDSLSSTSWADPRRYEDVLMFGYLELLETAKKKYGDDAIPAWLSNVILYCLSWYFRMDDKGKSPTHALARSTQQRFIQLCREILSTIGRTAILKYRVTRLGDSIRDRMLELAGEFRGPEAAYIDRLNRRRRLLRVKYVTNRYDSKELFLIGGQPYSPKYAKYRAVESYGTALIYERIAWLPAVESIELSVNGYPVELKLGGRADRKFTLTEWDFWRAFAPKASRPSAILEKEIRSARNPVPKPTPAEMAKPKRSPKSTPKKPDKVNPLRALAGRAFWKRRGRPTPADEQSQSSDAVASIEFSLRAARSFARSDVAKERYRDAWVFMDRLMKAGDNAEHLYDFVRTHHPEVNAWFVLSTESRDWARLEAAGVRLVGHGSVEHFALTRHADHLVCSDVSAISTQPFGKEAALAPRWRVTYLKHGVLVNDSSTWLNAKKLSRIITAAPAEHESVVADGSGYVYTEKEAVLCGLPRHDRLLERASSLAESDRRILLVAPTWRNTLLARSENADDILESKYWTHWRTLLMSAKLRDVADAAGLEIVFLPHPNMADIDYSLNGIMVVHYSDEHIQSILAQTRILVTDYSSIAFDIAYLQQCVVYYQFDADEFYAGQNYRPGYFDFREHGFGPVVGTQNEAVAAIGALCGEQERVPYVRRARDFFAARDGRNRERAFKSILRLDECEPYEWPSGTLEPTILGPALHTEMKRERSDNGVARRVEEKMQA